MQCSTRLHKSLYSRWLEYTSLVIYAYYVLSCDNLNDVTVTAEGRIKQEYYCFFSTSCTALGIQEVFRVKVYGK